MNIITASFDTLKKESTSNAGEWLEAGRRAIDGQFGTGFARQHPQLVAAFMQAAAVDFASATIGKMLGEIAESLSSQSLGD